METLEEIDYAHSAWAHLSRKSQIIPAVSMVKGNTAEKETPEGQQRETNLVKMFEEWDDETERYASNNP